MSDDGRADAMTGGLDRPVALATIDLADAEDPEDALDAALMSLGSTDGVGHVSTTVIDGSRSESWHPVAVPDDEHKRPRHPKASAAFLRAKDNVEKWGQQTAEVLLLALVEETGELADLMAPEPPLPPGDESMFAAGFARDAADLGENVQGFLEAVTEDDDGGPLDPDERPAMFESVETDPNALREELYDLMALCYQLDWALYQGEWESER